MSEGSACLLIPIVRRVRAIWHEVFVKLVFPFDALVFKKDIFSESSHFIETYIYVVIDIIEVHSIVYFGFCFGYKFIEIY